MLIAVGNGTSRFIHPDGNNVQMFPPDVVVAIDHIGLVAEPHALHVLFRQGDILSVIQHILRIGIERDVQDRLFGLAVGGQIVAERTGQKLDGTGFAADRLNDAVSEKDVGVPSVHFHLVIGEHTVQAASV